MVERIGWLIGFVLGLLLIIILCKLDEVFVN